MDETLVLKNRLKEARAEKKLSQAQLAAMVTVGMAVYALELLLVRDPALAEARRFFK